jgi:hypothetical protein
MYALSRSRAGDSFWEEEKASGNVGLAMMARMGWKEGSGLGKEGKGQVKAVSVRKRTDGLGLGAGLAQKQAEEMWKAATDVFNGVLGKLKPIGDNCDNNQVLEQEQDRVEESAALAVKRLSARAGLYSRFSKAKDVSRYSAEDLSAILGKKKDSSNDDDDDEESTVVVETQEDVFKKIQGFGVSGRGGLGFGKCDEDDEQVEKEKDSEQQKGGLGFVMDSAQLLKLAGMGKKKEEEKKEKKSKDKKRKRDSSEEKESKKKSKKDKKDKKDKKKKDKSSSKE